MKNWNIYLDFTNDDISEVFPLLIEIVFDWEKQDAGDHDDQEVREDTDGFRHNDLLRNFVWSYHLK